MLADKQLVDVLEEQPRLRTLDDAVVVGRGERDDLADAELGDDGRDRRPLYSGGKSSAPTPMIAPWPGMSRGTDWVVPSVPGLVIVTVDAGEVLDGELAGARLAHELLVGAQEAGEVERVGIA